MSYFNNDFSEYIWKLNYKYGTDRIISDTFGRVAEDIAKVEKNDHHYASKFFDLMNDGYFLPGGRILANAGTGLDKATCINCFVSGFQLPDMDSMNEIQNELKRQAKILCSEGGYGFCVSPLRPRGSRIGGVGVTTPGAVQMLDMWDTQAATIVAGGGQKKDRDDVKGKIRKGAQMVTMHDWHPDLLEFIKAKRDPTKLRKFNMSILISDFFMESVINDDEWKFIFPDYETNYERYKQHWNGNIHDWVSIRGEIKEYDSMPARELYDIIMKSTYNHNDPGILFVDRMNYWNNLNKIEQIDATNPCVAEGTLVNTPQGYRKVEDIKTGDYISTVLGKEPVKEIETHENYPVYKVTFSDGGEQIVTAAHQYHVKDHNAKSITVKSLSEISVGDSIRVRGDHQPFDFNLLEYERGLKKGILLGDGCYTEKAISHNNTIAISTSIDDSIYNENIKELFQTNRKLDTSGEGKAAKIWVTEAESLIDNLSLKKAKSYNKELDISNMSKSEMVGVLDGMIASDGDLNLRSNHPQIRYKSTSKNLVQAFRAMMIALGCHATISKRGPSNGNINGRVIKGNHDQYTAGLSGESIRNFAKYSRLDKIHPKKGDRLHKARTEFLLSGNYWYAKIESIEPAGTANVYDLYCEKSDTWITEGYVQRGCGEQILPRNGSCLLGNMILPTFVKLKEGKRVFDYDKFREKVHLAVRFLDNVNDISFVPLTEQYEELQNKRRIGLGHMGFGSLCYMLGIKYGSSKAASLASAIQYALMDEAYYASAKLAQEKEPFPLYDKNTFNRKYLNKLSDRTIEAVDQYGLRNSHLTSIQPTGNTSCLANNVSGGLEPIFMQSYQRSFEIPESEFGLEEKHIPRHIDWEHVEDNAGDRYDEYWDCIMQGNTPLLELKDPFGETYRISRSRGLTKVVDIKDFAVAQMTDKQLESDYAVTTTDLTVEEHVKMMKAFAEYVDSAMSKTVNIPSDYPYEKFKDVYMDAWKSGVIKGITTYRAGTSEAVLTETKKDADKHSTGDSSSLYNTNDSDTDTNEDTTLLSDEESELYDRESSSEDDRNGLLQLKLRIEALEKEVFKNNDRAAPKRPKSLPAKVTRVKHKGDIWHIAVGYLSQNNTPYEIFAFKVEGDYSSKEATITKISSGVYNLRFKSQDEIIRDITSHTPSDEARLITRLISLALRHGVERRFIINQISKANPSIASFGRAIEKALTNGYSWDGSLADRLETTGFADCCETPNIVYREGCVQCMNCGWSKC